MVTPKAKEATADKTFEGMSEIKPNANV